MDELTKLLIQQALARGPNRNIQLPPELRLSKYNQEEDQRLAKNAPPLSMIRPVRPRDFGLETLDHIMYGDELAKMGAYPRGVYDPSKVTLSQRDLAFRNGLRASWNLMHDDLERIRREEALGLDPYTIYQIFRKQ